MSRPSNSSELSGYTRFFDPVLKALRALGGAARSAQVKDKIIETSHLPDAELEEVLQNGVSKIGNQIDWARFYLNKTGYLSSSKRGVWALTEKGQKASLTADDVRRIVREVNGALRPVDDPQEGTLDAVRVNGSPSGLDHRGLLLDVIKQLPPAGFEELCRYLLLESGFEEVSVTGHSGDGGIDGHGVLRVNKLVSMKVFFQCKRYQSSVGPSIVRDFRGALSGRAEKGIIITTSSFTSSAEKEALRDGVVPIELVDGERLIELFEDMEIGLINPRKVYDIDDQFFDRFRKE